MSITDIEKSVRTILNEHGSDDTLSIGTDRVLLDSYIAQAIPDAVVMLAQKGYRVNPKEETSKAVTDGAYTLPNDYISLLTVKGSNWKKVVNKITVIGSPEYNMAMNSNTAPTVNRPMCYELRGDLILLPIPEKIDIEYNTTVATNSSINALPKEATAVCYMAAALVCGMFGDDNGKQRLSDIATNLLQ